MKNLKIKQEFKNLISPLGEDEFAQLQDNILNQGAVLSPISVWNNVILDGHNRWEIVCKHPERHIIFQTVEISGIENDNDAAIWIIKNQFGRRNLTDFDRNELAILLKEKIAIKAKENQREGGRNKGLANLPKPINARKEAAVAAGTKERQLQKHVYIKAKSPELLNDVRQGRRSYDNAYRAVGQAEKKEEMQKKNT